MKYISILTLLAVNLSHGANYYFSSQTGDDSRSSTQAQNSLTPWKSLNKLNSIFSSLQPGDVILFKRGEVFYGSIMLTRSGTTSLPIIFSAYGTGVKPIITGLVTLSGWTHMGNNIWESSNQIAIGKQVNILLWNSRSIPMGRYPNADAPNNGFRTYSSHVGNTSITDNTLPGTINWTGAELVLKKERWTFDRSKITNHSGSTLTYTTQTDYHAKNGFGYYIQNHIRTLDQPGEWYHNSGTGKVSIFSASVPPLIEAASVDNLVHSEGADHITFDQLQFKGSNQNTFEVGEMENLKLNECDILYSGNNGLFGFTLANLSILNSTFSNVNNNGIHLYYNCSRPVINYNTFENVGLSIGMANGLQYTTCTAIALSQFGGGTPNATVIGNKINNIGYNGIDGGQEGGLIKNNVISNFCLAKDDGGGIYTGSGIPGNRLRVIDNIIVEGGTAGEGTAEPNDTYTWGIYADDNAHEIVISGNTVAHMPNSGIFLHNAHEIDIIGNTVFNNNLAQIQFLHDTHDPIRNVKMNKNISVAKKASQRVFLFHSFQNDLHQFGTADSNQYARPLDKLAGYIYTNNVPRTLASWQSQVNQDITSKFSGVGVADTASIRLEYNATSTSKTIVLDSAYLGIDSTVYFNTVTLAPYSSLALFRVPGLFVLSKMFDLNGVKIGDKSSLTWETGDQIATSYFEIQRSSDGVRFITIGRVDVATTSRYSWTDVEPGAGDNHYRIKQVDHNGRFIYSSLVRLSYLQPANLDIAFGVSSDQLHVSVIGMKQPQKANLLLRTISGHALKTVPVILSNGNFAVDISSFPAGIYNVSITSDTRFVSKLFVKR